MDLSPGSKIKKFLNKGFQHKYNESFHKWYFAYLSKEQRQLYKNDYYQTLESEKQLRFFVP